MYLKTREHFTSTRKKQCIIKITEIRIPIEKNVLRLNTHNNTYLKHGILQNENGKHFRPISFFFLCKQQLYLPSFRLFFIHAIYIQNDLNT